MPTVRIVGPGRAGSSLAGALASAGWRVATPVRRGEDPVGAAAGVDLCAVAVPDAAIAAVAERIDPVASTLVVHLAGSLDAGVLGRHPRRAALHPLASLPDAATGTRTLTAGVWWAVDGDPGAGLVVAALGGRIIPVPPAARGAYHAAACIAANHAVTLMAQVERVAASAGLPAAPFYELAAAAVANAARTGATAALTGPAMRGDEITLRCHLDALEPAEQDLYLALARAAARLGTESPHASAPNSLATNRYRIGANALVGDSSCR